MKTIFIALFTLIAGCAPTGPDTSVIPNASGPWLCAVSSLNCAPRFCPDPLQDAVCRTLPSVWCYTSEHDWSCWSVRSACDAARSVDTSPSHVNKSPCGIVP